MGKTKIIIKHPQGDFTLESIQNDIEASKIKYSNYDFCFTRPTVQSLIDKIEELHQIIISDNHHDYLFLTISKEGTIDNGGNKISVKYYFYNNDTIHCQKEDGTKFYTSYKSLV